MRWRFYAALLPALVLAAPESYAFPERGMDRGAVFAQRLFTPEGRDGGGGGGGGGYGRGLPRPEPGPPDGGYGRGLPRPEGRLPDGGGFGRERRPQPRNEGGADRFWGGPYWGYGARLGHPCRWCSQNCAGGRDDERCRRCESRCGW